MIEMAILFSVIVLCVFWGIFLFGWKKRTEAQQQEQERQIVCLSHQVGEMAIRGGRMEETMSRSLSVLDQVNSQVACLASSLSEQQSEVASLAEHAKRMNSALMLPPRQRDSWSYGFDNPLSELKFEDFLDIAQLGDAIMNSAEKFTWEGVSRTAADASAVLTAAAQMKRMSVCFSDSTNDLLRAGTARLMISESGTKAVAVHTKTGKIVEQATVAGSSLAQKLMVAWTVVVGASHLIAGADIHKRLKAVERKLDLLQDLRETDLLARLEAIFFMVRRLRFPSNIWQRNEIHSLVLELETLRSTWRNQLLPAVQHLGQPNFLNRKAGLGSSGDVFVDQLNALGDCLAKMDAALRLEVVLIGLEGDEDQAEGLVRAFPEEADRLTAISNRIREVASQAGKGVRAKGEPDLCTALDWLAASYQQAENMSLERGELRPSALLAGSPDMGPVG